MKKASSNLLPLASVAGLVLAAPAAEAAVINILPENVTASSEIGGAFNRQDDFLVDGSGLTGGPITHPRRSLIATITGARHPRPSGSAPHVCPLFMAQA